MGIVIDSHFLLFWTFHPPTLCYAKSSIQTDENLELKIKNEKFCICENQSNLRGSACRGVFRFICPDCRVKFFLFHHGEISVFNFTGIGRRLVCYLSEKILDSRWGSGMTAAFCGIDMFSSRRKWRVNYQSGILTLRKEDNFRKAACEWL